mgnify:CR=1 FL=1
MQVDVPRTAQALMVFELCLATPLGRATDHSIDDRLLPPEWLQERRLAWIAQLEKAMTLAQLALAVQEQPPAPSY